MPPLTIRPCQATDWPAVWALLEPTFRAGETYTFAPDISEAEARQLWIELPSATFVALDEAQRIVGTYFIKPNQPGLGSHVCNCGYVVDENARGLGVASAMCEHSQREAVARGFRAMQFNFVVSTNEGAVRLWKKLGFAIVGTLPRAYRHARLGEVDAYVMFKTLGADAAVRHQRTPEVTGIDHLYVTVSDIARSEAFYDRVLPALGYRKNRFALNGEPHVQYYNRHFGYVLRPARSMQAHDPYAPGLHHFCLRVDTVEDVHAAAAALKAAGIDASEPHLHSGYAPDYWATFFTDPDGIRLEITNYRQERRERHDRWNELPA